MTSHLYDSYRDEKLTEHNSDESWLFSRGNWTLPDPNAMSKYTGYQQKSSDEELYLFNGKNDISQPLIGRKTKYALPSPRCFTLLAIGILMITSAALMAMLPCPTGAFINKIFKFTDTNSGIERLPGQDIQESLYSNKTFKIALLGDSLINKPYIMFNLAGRIQAYLPGYHLELTNCGSNGAVIGKYPERASMKIINFLTESVYINIMKGY